MTPAEVEYALHRLNDRLRKVETHLGLRPPEPAAGAPVQPQPQTPQPAPVRRTTPVAEPSDPAMSGNWLGIAAVICFVLAAGFIVRLSIESGWLTPARQIGLSALLGLSLIGAGGYLARTDRAYASFLPAAGIIVLYLTTFAAHRLYNLIPFDVALGVISLISGISIWLYVMLRHDIYTITAAAGAYLSPVVLDLNAQSDFALYYFLLCSVAFAAISLWVRTRTLTLIAAYLALVMTAVIGFDLKQDMLVATAMALHFFIFSAGIFLYSLHNKSPLTETESWAFLPVLLAFYALEYYFIFRITPELAPYISLGFAALLIGLYVIARTCLPDDLASQTLVLTFGTLVAFHSGYLVLLPPEARPWLLPLILLTFAFTPVAEAVTGQVRRYLLPLVAVALIVLNEYGSLLYHLLLGNDPAVLLVAFVSFASLWTLIIRRQMPTTWGYGLLGAAHLLAIMAFYRLGYSAGSLAVSVMWLVYAAGVMVFAFVRKDAVIARSALTVLALAAGKALLYDAASAPTVVRIFCLLLTGAALYGCGLLMRRISAWKP
jgi:hypothetical protein